ncbi:MAG: hypothetical protein ACWA5L_01575 [bacterium]
MNIIKRIGLSLIPLMAMASVPAQASSQSDVNQCRQALDQQGSLPMSEYRLRYQSKKGSRTVTYKLQAIPYNGQEKQNVICVVKRGKVLSVDLVK